MEEKKDRSKFYKKPMRFGAQTLYQGETLEKISLDHWKKFDENARSKKGFMVGDFIDTAVNTTAIQLVAFLDEFKNMNSIEDVRKKCDEYIEEIQKEIKLD